MRIRGSALSLWPPPCTYDLKSHTPWKPSRPQPLPITTLNQASSWQSIIRLKLYHIEVINKSWTYKSFEHGVMNRMSFCLAASIVLTPTSASQPQVRRQIQESNLKGTCPPATASSHNTNMPSNRSFFCLTYQESCLNLCASSSCWPQEVATPCRSCLAFISAMISL